MAATRGFRFSISDGLFIAAGLVALVAGRGAAGPFIWVVPIAIGHFFLFCNVFRVRRSYELVWAASFLVNVTAWLYLGPYQDGRLWLGVLAVQLPVTVAAIVLEIRGGRYRGVFSRPPADPSLDQAP